MSPVPVYLQRIGGEGEPTRLRIEGRVGQRRGAEPDRVAVGVGCSDRRDERLSLV